MEKKRFWTTGFLGAAVVLASWGCSTPERVTTMSYAGFTGTRIQKMGVMPFFKGRHPTNVKENLNCNLCKLVFDPQSVDTGAERALTRFLYEAVYERYQDRVLPQDRVEAVRTDLPQDDETDTPLTLTRKMGQSIGANVMLLGTVWRYRDKTGSSASSMNPASVSFDVYLVDVRTGETLWTANFEETQRSLSENIWDVNTFFQRGAKWLTANELARYGIQEIVKQMPL
jgi:hypothetical protein